MAQQVINVGAAADDHTGDPLRTSFQKTNANFTEVYTGYTMTGNLTLSTGTNSAVVSLRNTASGTTINDGFEIALGSDNFAYVNNHENTPIIFGINDTEMMQLNQTGFLKLMTGANSPVILMTNDVSGTSGGSQGFELGTDGSNAWIWNYESGRIEFGVNNAEHMNLTTLGLNLTYSGQVTLQLLRNDAALDQKNWEFLHNTDGSLVIRAVNEAYSNASNALTIGRGSGFLTSGVQVGSPTGGDKGVGSLNATAVYANGTLLTSDASLKRDIGDLPTCLPLVTAIEPKSYRWREPDDPNTVPLGWADQTRWGFVAQDVERVLAGHEVSVVDVGADGTRGLSLGDMTAVLWKAVKELTARLEAVEAKLP